MQYIIVGRITFITVKKKCVCVSEKQEMWHPLPLKNLVRPQCFRNQESAVVVDSILCPGVYGEVSIDNTQHT